MKIAYLGPQGTFTQEALNRYDTQHIYEKISCASIEEAIARCKTDCDYALVPVENSLGGSVITTLDYLMEYEDVTIVKEFIMPINHYLYGLAKIPLSEVQAVHTHVQALRQCSHFLKEQLPQAKLMVENSTAMAGELIIANNSPYACIIGSAALAKAYPLVKLAGPLQNVSENWTRFLLLQHKDNTPLNYNIKQGKLSLICQLDGLRPGSLYEALGIFAREQINLVHIESRPLGRRLGEYKFFFDLEVKENQQLQKAVEELNTVAKAMVIMGIYPLVNLAAEE